MKKTTHDFCATRCNSMWQNSITVSVLWQSVPEYTVLQPRITLNNCQQARLTQYVFADFNTLYGVTVMHVYVLCNNDRSRAQTNNREFE